MKSKIKVISSNQKPTDKSLHKGEIAIGKAEDVPNKVFANDGNGVKDITGSKVLYFQTQDELDKFIADGKAPEGVNLPVSVPKKLSGKILSSDGNVLSLEPDYANSDTYKLRLNDSDKYLNAKVISTDGVDVSFKTGFSYDSSDTTTVVTGYTGTITIENNLYPLIGLVDLYYLLNNTGESISWHEAVSNVGDGSFTIYAVKRTDDSGLDYYVPLMPERTIRFRQLSNTTTFTPFYAKTKMASITNQFPELKALDAGQSVEKSENVYHVTLTVNDGYSSSTSDMIKLGSFSTDRSGYRCTLNETITAETGKVFTPPARIDLGDLTTLSNADELTESERKQIGELTPLFPRFFTHVVLDDYFDDYGDGKVSETKFGTATTNLIAVDGDLDSYISANAKNIKMSASGINWSDDTLSRASATTDADSLSLATGDIYNSKLSKLFDNPSKVSYGLTCTLTVPAQTAGEKVVPDGVWYAVVMDDKVA